MPEVNVPEPKPYIPPSPLPPNEREVIIGDLVEGGLIEENEEDKEDTKPPPQIYPH